MNTRLEQRIDMHLAFGGSFELTTEDSRSNLQRRIMLNHWLVTGRSLSVKLIVPCLAAFVLLAWPAYSHSQDSDEESADNEEQAEVSDREVRGPASRESKTGFTTSRPIFGGPTSPEGELEEADRLKEPAFRFPSFDAAFKPWAAWK